MSIFFRLFLSILMCLLLVGFPARAQDDKQSHLVAVNPAEASLWQEDLRFMAERMPKRHINLFHTMKPENFEAAIKSLHERIPQLARHEIIVEMARIVAMVGDGHTILRLAHEPQARFHTLPINLYFFEDGLFVRSANREHTGLVGARVVRIGNVSVEEATARARNLVGRDNEMDVKFFAPYLLIKPEILHALKISNDLETIQLTIEKEGKQQIVSIKPTNPTEVKELNDTDTSWLNEPDWTDMRDGATVPSPLWLKDVENKFWYEYLPDSKTIYVQINEIGNKKEESLAAFSKRLFAFVEANPVEKMILDLRLNRGGRNTLLTPLVTDIIKSKINQPGKLFTIMGRSTWSAAQNFLNALEKYTNTQFVGEPSGSKGNVYSDSRFVTLPNSKINVRVSIYYWQDWNPWDTRQWTAPHLSAELSSADYRSNIDPAMKAILNYAPRPTLTEVLSEALNKEGIEQVGKRFREYKAQPINKYVESEPAFLSIGGRLLAEKKLEQAAILFKLNLEENPHSPRAYFALGETFFQMGNKEQAIKNFEKTLEINPKHYDASARLELAKKN